MNGSRRDRRTPGSPGAGFPLPLDRVTPKSAAAAVAASREVLRPQRPLQQAAADAARAAAPVGLGLDSAAVRQRMADRLRADGLVDEAVLGAFAAVERHRFVDSALANQAYEDTALPIGHGQTISKPSVIGRMLALLRQGRTAAARGDLGRVLEIGGGCGYQAALLAQLARSVISLERIEPLAARATRNLEACGVRQVRVLHGDGRAGYAPRAPYDSIIAAAGGEDLPPAWLDQLAIGGRLVAPVAQGPGGVQHLVVVDRDERGCTRQVGEAVRFVPLKSGIG